MAEQETYRYQDLFNFAPDGYVVTDPHGLIQEANWAIASLLAVEQSYLVTTPLFIYISPPDRRTLRNLLNELTHQPQLQKLQTEELSLTSPKRGTIPVAITITAMRDHQMQVVSVRWLIQDITARKQAEATLRQSEGQARLAVEVAQLGTWRYNLDEDVIELDPRMREMWGVAKDVGAISLSQAIERIHPDDRERAAIAVRSALDPESSGTYALDYRIIWDDGTVRWLSTNGQVQFEGEGESRQPVDFFGTSLDISDRKQVEAEREQLLAREQVAREAAEAANRIKDEFLAVVSHELRTPLNPILGWSKLLRTRQLNEQKIGQALEVIERNALMQAQLINDLLDVSRILRGKLSLESRPVDLIATVQAALETVQLAAEAKNIELTFEIAGDRAPTELPQNVPSSSSASTQRDRLLVSGDASRLQQIFWNLLTNAVKFTPEGGRVEVQLSLVSGQQSLVSGQQPLVEKQITNDQGLMTNDRGLRTNYIQITITDTGKGIPGDFLPHVFERFRQENSSTTRRFGGLGLGLAIVRYLVELHGGRVWASSDGEGQGSTFTVQLPLLQSKAELQREQGKPLDAASSTNTDRPLTGSRILVVDDDTNTREFLAFLLELHGANVTTATSANEAIALFTQFQPDLLLSDIGMPNVDGYMMMQHLRALPPEKGGTVPAIALTAYASEFDQQKAFAMGFQQHLSKPVEPETLIGAIVQLLGQSAAGHPVVSDQV